MKPMQVKTMGFDVGYDTKPALQENVRCITIEFEGQQFIIEADAGGLVIQSKNSEMTIGPDSKHMIHIGFGQW